MKDEPTPIVHVITGLMVGGAEIALERLIAKLDRTEFPAAVISLLPEDAVGERIRSLGSEVVSLGMRRGRPSARAWLDLRAALARLRPRVVQGWMPHGNLAAWAGLLSWRRTTPLAWNIRQTIDAPKGIEGRTRWVTRASAALSQSVDAIVFNSHAARRQHEAIGFRGAAHTVIPNGFDIDHFRPDREARASLRRELGVASDRLLVGLVNRFHAMKDHDTFLAAARSVIDSGLPVTFICAGTDVDSSNRALTSTLTRLGLGDQVILMGQRTDTARLFAGLDVACLSSAWGEGFPNVLGEAMACATPCVATAVGDAAVAVGDTGIVAPARDAAGFAAAILVMLRETPEQRLARGLAARQRITQWFSLDRCAAQYAQLYRSLANEASQ